MTDGERYARVQELLTDDEQKCVLEAVSALYAWGDELDAKTVKKLRAIFGIVEYTAFGEGVPLKYLALEDDGVCYVKQGES